MPFDQNLAVRVRATLCAGAVFAVLLVLSTAAPAGAQTLTWSLVPSPNKAASDILNGVSCRSAARCTAVGFANGANGIPGTLAESWNGTRWSVVPSPTPAANGDVLESVSCVSATVCMAAGESLSLIGGNPRKTLTESWNGTRWSVVPSPNPGGGNALNSVFCISADDCTAVGYYVSGRHLGTLIESWNGTRWSVVPSPNPRTKGNIPQLTGVSCPSPTACMASGDFFTNGGPQRTLIESWNGTRWSVVPSPSRGSDSYLDGVSCPSPSACMAAGYFTRGGPDGPEHTLIESWNGTRWSVVPSPGRGNADTSLSSVSCTAATACTAIGYSAGLRAATLVESWNGTRWSIVASPNHGNASYLNTVSCASAAACMAVGNYDLLSSDVVFRTLTESGTAGSP